MSNRLGAAPEANKINAVVGEVHTTDPPGGAKELPALADSFALQDQFSSRSPSAILCNASSSGRPRVRTMSERITAVRAARQSPVATATPVPDAIQIEAAVVNPWTTFASRRWRTVSYTHLRAH